MTNKLFHIFVALALVGLLTTVSDPFMIWMPPSAQMPALLAAAVCACLWAGFVMYERSHDEREMLHTMQAGRVAYLSGIAILTLGLVLEGLQHHIDMWIPLTLSVMVLSKLFARLYSEQYQ